jgi:hypothetical protein
LIHTHVKTVGFCIPKPEKWALKTTVRDKEQASAVIFGVGKSNFGGKGVWLILQTIYHHLPSFSWLILPKHQ